MKTYRLFGMTVPGAMLAWVTLVALTLLSVAAAGSRITAPVACS